MNWTWAADNDLLQVVINLNWLRGQPDLETSERVPEDRGLPTGECDSQAADNAGFASELCFATTMRMQK